MKTKHLGIDASRFKFDEANRTFEGYASEFNSVDSYGDTVLPGAYKETLENRERPVRMRFNHFGPVIGKWLELREDDFGLFAKGQLTEGHSVAEDAYASLKHGAIDGLSIGYRVTDSEPNDHGGEDLKGIELIEISVVEEPADLGARIANIKSDLDAIESLKDMEAYLRDACGIPRSAATALVSRIKAMSQSDSEPEPQQSDSVAGRCGWRMYRALVLKQ